MVTAKASPLLSSSSTIKEGDNEEEAHNHVPDPVIRQLNNQQPMPNNEEDNEPEQLEDYVGMEDLENDGSNNSSDIAMTLFELMQRCKTEAPAQRKRCFMDALVVDFIRDEEERLQASPITRGE
ncbi:unnamed protein product [Microthlaspi erraticum]|uniref:Uncharacterized protein n=1 Tax=Microthlaspi erraticum TaxID=1685480 RepID=A0A6D2J8X9_9BRAS|nr:unnamed protein product [Microthlaspi erraticum]